MNNNNPSVKLHMCKLKKWHQTMTMGVKNKICFTPLNCVPYKRTTLNVDFDTNFIIFTRVSLKFTKPQKLKIWNITQNYCLVFVKPKVILITVKNENQSYGWHAIYFIRLVLKTYHFSSKHFWFFFSKNYFYS